MGFKEVASLDADVTISIGKLDRKTGKQGPKSAEGYYLGSRTVQNKRGESKLHFLQTEKGNVGVWGTTDMNRKLSQVVPGTMVRITSNGTKPTPNGDMYMYRVELDETNTIEADSSFTSGDNESTEDAPQYEENFPVEEDNSAELLAAELEKKKKVQAILNRNKTK